MTRTALAAFLAIIALGPVASADPAERWGGNRQQQNGNEEWRDRDRGGENGDFRGRRGPEPAPQVEQPQIQQAPIRPPQPELSGGPAGDRGRGRFEGGPAVNGAGPERHVWNGGAPDGGDRRRGDWNGDRRPDTDHQANRDIDRERRDFGHPDRDNRSRVDGGRNDWGRNDWRHDDRGRNDWGRNDWGRNDWGRGDPRYGQWRDRDDRHYALRDRDRGRSWYAPDRYRSYYRVPYRFRAPPYRYPAGWFSRQWRYGDYLPYGWFEPYYYLDWRAYGLDFPPIGCEWVRVGTDALLIDVYSGQILSVAYDIFY